MKHKIRFLCLLLALLLIGQSLPLQTSAEETGTILHIDVPKYFQDDYPETAFGKGTIASDGSSIVSLSMVLSCIKGDGYLPDVLADSFRTMAVGTSGIDYISMAVGVSCKKTGNAQDLVDSLREGKIAIAHMEKDSLFTDSEHFIVLTGMTADGTILVNDPLKAHYEDETLRGGLASGFAQKDILKGCSGGWIYSAGTTQTSGRVSDAVKNRVPTTSKTGISETASFAQDKVPLYFQDDYPNDRFGYGTVASSGCSVTSLAMVATYLTGHKYTPDELAKYCGWYGKNNIERMEYGADLLQLPWHKAENIHDVMSALQEGDVVIVMEGPESIFTESQHFIVLTGMTEDGKILVNDSNKSNYDHWRLKKGFESGFTEGEIVRGYSGAWIFDVDAMPEEPFIYMEEEYKGMCRYPGIELTWEEQQLLAKIIWVEARGESKEGQQAVAEVVYNRMMSPEFPDKLSDVIFSQGQFESVAYLEDVEPVQAQYEALEDALSGPYVLPIEVVHFSRKATNDKVWGKIGGHIFCYSSETYMGKGNG